MMGFSLSTQGLAVLGSVVIMLSLVTHSSTLKSQCAVVFAIMSVCEGLANRLLSLQVINCLCCRG